MIQNRHIIKSLPLLAAALGRKYGVEVVIGGDRACTDGKTIYLPTLPQDCSDTLLGLVRGYIDHESAHLRETDFEILQAVQLTPLEKHIWNSLEDWRVEHKLAAVFPGCRQNLTWLIRHIFLNTPEKDSGQDKREANVASVLIPNWLLTVVRSWDVPELEPRCEEMAAAIESDYPGLVGQLDPILQIVHGCKTSRDCLDLAMEIARLLSEYVEQAEAPEQPELSDPSKSDQNPHSGNRPANPLQQLENLLNSRPDDLPLDIGAATAEKLGEYQEAHQNSGRGGVVVATLGHKDLTALDGQTESQAKAATNALRARLQGLLQSRRLVRGRSACRGKLDTRKLHRISAGDAQIFLGKTIRQAPDTAVHILLDSSGSMSNQQMVLACAACYAAAAALHAVPGINLAVTAFPGNPLSGDQASTVVPILRHGQKLHNRFSLAACGSTPMDSAIWWTLQQMLFLPETRKIILIISDGDPDRFAATQKAIQTAQAIGHEVYGIGIDSSGIQRLLPNGSKVIRCINELAPAMFGMLQKTLLGKIKGD